MFRAEPLVGPLVRGLVKTLPAALAVALSVSAWAGEATLRIPLPKKSKPTPVQELNQEGVKAVERHQYEKAKKLFYKAYLLDPNDPFTLNNLGYIAELEGEVERAQRFYALAQEMRSEAQVARATSDKAIGKRVAEVAGNAEQDRLQINRLNVAAIGLLQKDRAPEADVLLTRALQLDPNNAFTLNNLGFAKEKQGELEAALGFYTKAANSASADPVIVTRHKDWRGRAISEVARENAEKVRELLREGASAGDRVARLNLQGVSAINRNDLRTARKAFEQAHKLRPNDAFTLNNMGYLAELDGDRETANFYYRKAQEARRAGAKVGVATRKDAEGRPLVEVAEESTENVNSRIRTELAMKRRNETGPVLLKRRDGGVVVPPPEPVAPSRREGGDVVSIPVPRDTVSAQPGPAVEIPRASEPEGAVVDSTAEPAATPQQPVEPQTQPEQPEPALVEPEQLEQLPKVESSVPR